MRHHRHCHSQQQNIRTKKVELIDVVQLVCRLDLGIDHSFLDEGFHPISAYDGTPGTRISVVDSRSSEKVMLISLAGFLVDCAWHGANMSVLATSQYHPPRVESLVEKTGCQPKQVVIRKHRRWSDRQHEHCVSRYLTHYRCCCSFFSATTSAISTACWTLPPLCSFNSLTTFLGSFSKMKPLCSTDKSNVKSQEKSCGKVLYRIEPVVD